MEYPVDDGEHECEKERWPETKHQEARDDIGSEQYQKRIDNERKEPERNNGYWERKDEEYWSDEQIQCTKNDGGGKGTDRSHHDVRNDIRCDPNRES